MTVHAHPGATIAEVEHHIAEVDGAQLHYVSAGTAGSPILLVHGFPESWWAFHKVIPLLAETHRVFAVDLRGMGDSSVAEVDFDSATAAEDLHKFIDTLGIGAVHLVGQDFAGATVARLVVTYPENVRSFTAIEMGLPGYGLEALADVTHGGTWHIGVLAAPGIPELMLVGRERELIGGYSFPAMTAVQGSVSDADIDEFVRGYARPGGLRGASGLYRSMLVEGEDLRILIDANPVAVPVLAIGGGGGAFTEATMTQVTAGHVESIILDGVGHYVALEAPDRLADALLTFVRGVEID